MTVNPFASKTQVVCQIHGNRAKSGNGMLVCMILAVLSLIMWHVWVYGTSGRQVTAGAASFPRLLGNELLDLLFNKKGILAELWEVLPYFLVGVLIAGYLRTFKIAVKLQASLRKYGVLSVFLASFVGIITPLCACGTLTTAISLLFAGIPLAPVMSLMVTSPLLSPSTYLLTLNDLGPEWTVIRTVSALSMGIFAGLVTHLVSKLNGFRQKDIFMEGAIIRGDFHDEDYPDERLRCSCRRNFGNRVAVRTGNSKFPTFLAKSVEMLWVVGKYVIVGVVFGAVVERYMPKEWIYRLFGRRDHLSILWVTLASVPIFLHQISASSIIYHIKGALNGTIDTGAALAFMIGGPVTAVPTMVLFWTFFKKRVFFLYMLVCITGTILIAFSFQFLVFVPGVDLGNPLLKGVGSLSGGATAVILKHGANVRMVLDPAGKGIVATCTNDIDGQGGVVFDASPGRFTNGTDLYDNRQYIVNTAEWLKQNTMSAVPGKILVYNFGDSGGGGSSILGEKTLAGLLQNGFTVTETDRRDTPQITGRLLADYGQVWLFFGSRRENGPSDAEVKRITDYTANGGSALIVPDRPGSGSDCGQEASRLSSLYGVTFSGVVENRPEIHVSSGANFLERTSTLLAALLKVVKKA
jgi:uncharacterized protein